MPSAVTRWNGRRSRRRLSGREQLTQLGLAAQVPHGDCGLPREAAEDALNMLRCLVRGYVLNEMMHTLIGVYSYEDSFENSVRVFVAGLPALTCAVHERQSHHM